MGASLATPVASRVCLCHATRTLGPAVCASLATPPDEVCVPLSGPGYLSGAFRFSLAAFEVTCLAAYVRWPMACPAAHAMALLPTRWPYCPCGGPAAHVALAANTVAPAADTVAPGAHTAAPAAHSGALVPARWPCCPPVALLPMWWPCCPCGGPATRTVTLLPVRWPRGPCGPCHPCGGPCCPCGGLCCPRSGPCRPRGGFCCPCGGLCCPHSGPCCPHGG